MQFFTTQFIYVQEVPSQVELDSMLLADGFRPYQVFTGDVFISPPPNLETWEPPCKWPVVVNDRDGVPSAICLSTIDRQPIPSYIINWIQRRLAGCTCRQEVGSEPREAAVA